MPVSENRFLQSFFAVAASAVLVGGTLILLTSTSPWTPPQQTENEPSTPDSARLSPPAEAIDLQFPRAPHDSDQGRTGPAAEPQVADRTYTASTGEEPVPQEPEQPLAPEASSADDDALAALGTPLDPESDGSVDAEDIDTEAMITNGAAPASESTAANEAAPKTDTAALREPDALVARDESNAATDQIGELLTALPPRAIASDRSEEATDEVADLLAASPPAPIVSDTSEAATPEVTAVLTPPPPLPARKPAGEPPAPKAAALPAPQDEKPSRPEEKKQNAAQQDVAQQEAAQPNSNGPWQPMALAPAENPSISLSKAPTARPSGAAYASTVWSALARHKPRAGQRGSATVVFAIGGNGALRAVRVGRSSGNTRLDQLALATVRNAAPFPPPPSGAASYTIRIDFQ